MEILETITKFSRWIKQEDDIIFNEYPDKTIFEVQKLLPHRSVGSIKHRKRFLGIKKRNFTSINENFFAEPNIVNSAISGFIAADGCITNHRLIITISYKDYDFLVRIASIMNFEGKIHISKRISINRIIGNGTKPSNFTSKYCTFAPMIAIKTEDDLKNIWSIIPKKTLTLKPPKLKSLDHVLAFISGNICGDGWITASKNNKYKLSFRLMINMLGTQDLLNWIKTWFDKLTPLDTIPKVSKDKDANMYCYTISGARAYIISKMILSLDIPRLDRKWNVARKYIETVETMAKNGTLSVEMHTKIKRMLSLEILTFLQKYAQDISIFTNN